MVHIRTDIVIAIPLLAASATAQAALDIFSCEPEWAALAEEIGGEHVEASSATTAYQDPHHIQARPSLIAKTRRADLVICTGADLEAGWLPLLLRKAGNPAVREGEPGFLEVSKHVELLDQRESVDRSEGDVHAAGNPHLHLDPRNLLKIAAVIKQRLQQLDPDNTTFYATSFDAFEQRWSGSIERWQDQLKPLRGKMVITHHNYWPYLAAFAGIEIIARMEPRPGVQPSSRHLADLVAQTSGQVALIIRVNYANPRASAWLAERLEIPVIELQSTVDHQQGETLIAWYGSIVERLIKATEE